MIEFAESDEGLKVYRPDELHKIGVIQNNKFIHPSGKKTVDELEAILTKMKELQGENND